MTVLCNCSDWQKVREVLVLILVEHRSAESKGLRFDSSWELRTFSLSHARNKTKDIFVSSLFLNLIM